MWMRMGVSIERQKQESEKKTAWFPIFAEKSDVGLVRPAILWKRSLVVTNVNTANILWIPRQQYFGLNYRVKDRIIKTSISRRYG